MLGHSLGSSPAEVPVSPSARIRALQTRLLAGDPDAARDVEHIALLSNLEEMVSEAAQVGELREHRFASPLPVIGPAIAALRSALYALSARWPLRAALGQQTLFNRAVARTLTESLALNHRLLERIERLEARVAELERERRE